MNHAPMRVLVIGSRGQVARALLATLPRHGFDVAVAARPQIDLARPETVAAAIRRVRPQVVINPAAYTLVDRAEDEPALAMAINADGARAVAEQAREAGAAILHLSTDYVFDGTKSSPYVETDPAAPLGVYGRSKLAGERAVAAANPRHAILRTAWVCSPYGSNFLLTMLRLAGERTELRVVDDQRGAPTFAADIAEAIVPIVAGLGQGGGPDDRCGIFHIASAGEATWCGFARAIMAGSAARGGPCAKVVPIPGRDYPAKAARPAYSKLSTDKLKRVFGIDMPDWQDGLSRCLDAHFGTQPEGRGAR